MCFFQQHVWMRLSFTGDDVIFADTGGFDSYCCDTNARKCCRILMNRTERDGRTDGQRDRNPSCTPTGMCFCTVNR